jgi:hypothetical protein
VHGATSRDLRVMCPVWAVRLVQLHAARYPSVLRIRGVWMPGHPNRKRTIRRRSCDKCLTRTHRTGPFGGGPRFSRRARARCRRCAAAAAGPRAPEAEMAVEPGGVLIARIHDHRASTSRTTGTGSGIPRPSPAIRGRAQRRSVVADDAVSSAQHAGRSRAGRYRGQRSQRSRASTPYTKSSR